LRYGASENSFSKSSTVFIYFLARAGILLIAVIATARMGKWYAVLRHGFQMTKAVIQRNAIASSTVPMLTAEMGK
jgi:hypothetical protein